MAARSSKIIAMEPVKPTHTPESLKKRVNKLNSEYHVTDEGMVKKTGKRSKFIGSSISVTQAKDFEDKTKKELVGPVVQVNPVNRTTITSKNKHESTNMVTMGSNNNPVERVRTVVKRGFSMHQQRTSSPMKSRDSHMDLKNMASDPGSPERFRETKKF